MGRIINLKGMTFGRWFVKSFAHINKRGSACWNCICSCSRHTKRVVVGTRLHTGVSQSCGCLADKRASKLVHGHALGGNHSPTYRSWASMHDRCTNPNMPNYKYYGGAGITICKAWRKFTSFYKSMGARPDGTTLGRFKDSGDYKPSNCAWMTRAQHEVEHKKKTL